MGYRTSQPTFASSRNVAAGWLSVRMECPGNESHDHDLRDHRWAQRRRGRWVLGQVAVLPMLERVVSTARTGRNSITSARHTATRAVLEVHSCDSRVCVANVVVVSSVLHSAGAVHFCVYLCIQCSPE